MTSADRWERAQAIFHEALEMDEDRRARFVHEACAGDLQLEDEVASLIQAALASDGFFDGLSERLGEIPGYDEEPTDEEPPPDLTGRRVGAYELVRLLGHGGMGVVYEARRVDGEFEHTVALKLLPIGASATDSQRRFRAERSILARLEHPGVARLLDGGVTEDGTPYFVMELVDGEPIHDYCDRHRLGVRERLELFLQACEAVSYAHRNLVVHRDLKPSNIFVTVDGAVKLLDFGIAKLLDDAGDKTVLVEQRLTPAYASPEQLTGGTITTASDVYGLGVVLHELLTGLSPYERESNTTHSLMDLVVRETVPGPSGRVGALLTRRVEGIDLTALAERRGETAAGLKKRLRGDLDNIVLMALRKEPERRYASAAELGDDVRRHIDGYPVRARAETLSYTMGRFVARNRAAVASAMLVLLMLVTLVAVQTNAARTRAQLLEDVALERDKLQVTVDFLEQLFTNTNPVVNDGRTVTALELLDRGTDQVLQDGSLEPLTRASLMAVLGITYHYLGEGGASEPLLRQALEIQRAALPNPSAETAETLYNLGVTLRDGGETEEALELLEESLGMRLALGGLDHAVATTRFAVARTLHHAGRFLDAETAFADAVEQFRSLDLEPDEDYAFALYTWAEFLQVKGEYDAAEPLYREALGVLDALRPGDTPNKTAMLIGLGGVASGRGQDAEAEAFFRQALEIDRRLYAEVDDGNHVSFAMTVFTLGRHLTMRGQEDEGVPLLEEALDMYRNATIKQPDMHGTTATIVGDYYQGAGRPARAEALYREAMEVLEQTFGAGSLMQANTQISLARLLGADGRSAEARRLVQSSLEAYAPYLPDDHPRVRAARAVLDSLGSESSGRDQ